MSELTKAREGEALPDHTQCVVYAGGCWHIVEARQGEFYIGKHRLTGVTAIYKAGQ